MMSTTDEIHGHEVLEMMLHKGKFTGHPDAFAFDPANRCHH